jgi:twitching motility protein PilU
MGRRDGDDVNTNIPTFDELSLPPCSRCTMSKRGIMMFIGATGAGKSTSMAALLIPQREQLRPHHHDRGPFEFSTSTRIASSRSARSGSTPDNWGIALKNTLRQAPDVILIGEVRDRDTMDYAIAFAERGTCAWPPYTRTAPTRR